MRCFADYGYHQTTMDKVAEESGLSKGSLYRFFRSKDELLLAILDRWDKRVAERFKESAELDPLARLDDYCRAAAAEFEHQNIPHGMMVEFLSHPDLRPRLQILYKSTLIQLSEIITAGIEQGQLRSTPAAETAEAMLAMLEGVLVLAMVDPDKDFAASMERVWRLFRASIVVTT